MKTKFSLIQKIAAFTMSAAMFSPIFAVGASAQTRSKTAAKSLTENQKILHVLNRLGFGARAGDVERVKRIGIDKYVEQQLNPASLNDAVADAKVKNLDVLKMSSAELFNKFPNQAAILLAVADRNGLQRQDLQGLRQNNNQNNNSANQEMKAEPMSGATDGGKQLSAAERQKYQREIAELYAKYKLGRPQQITQQLNAARIMRAVYSERQLQEVMVDFWTNHFNVYAGKAATRWFLPHYDRDVIRPNALGNFKDLLQATAQSPAMLFYLDNHESVAPNAQPTNGGRRNPKRRAVQTNPANEPNAERREKLKKQYGLTDAELDARIKANQTNPKQPKRMPRGINENYAREIMELHTLGVDGGYTQADIREVARAFTGWTIVDARGYRRAFASLANGAEDKRLTRLARLNGLPEDAESGTFFFNERVHDAGEKTVLGQKINEGGIKDGLKVIDVLVNHPSTAKFIARKLAVKFVSDAPSEALVGRVATAFQNSKGDIKTTLRALFADKEFFAPGNYRAKIKTPFEVVVSALRTVGAETNGGQIQALLAKMGEPLYGFQAPTGYPDSAADWVNTGALLERLNFAVALASNRIPGTRVDLKSFAGRDRTQTLNQAIAVVLDGEISPNTKASLLKQIEQPLAEPKIETVADETDDGENMAMTRNQGGRNRQNRQIRLLAPSGDAEVFKVVGLILGTPEFQRQ